MDHFTSSSYVSTITIIITIILTLTTIPATLCRRSDEFNACSKTFTCGNMTGLSYPFYGLNRPQYCGHPGFELLNCDQNTQKIQIMILSQKFYVFDINSTASTMRVARQDFFDGSGCPLVLANITIDFSIFQYTDLDANMTLIYDKCALKCPNFSCPWGGTKSVPYLPICFLTDKLMVKFNMSNVICPKKLMLPVHKTDVLAMDEAGRYLPTSAWNGFQLKWNANDGLCQECVGSGGQCGHDSKSNKFFCFCTDESKCPFPGSIDKGRRISLSKLNVALIACFSVTGICLIILLVIFFRRRYSSKDRVDQRERRTNVETFLRGHGSSGPKRYTYNDLKKITNSFKDKLGEGGYGSVYKGILQNGTPVAIKMLHRSKEEGAEFINEVASIGNTNHVNVVKLYGFCYEGHRRGLVYEFMANGSLEKFLYTGGESDNDHHSLGWETLFEIAIGVARGLEYLHRGCNTRILHFDIKPHNILLDENFCPKISDFGLSKSCPQKDSLISMSEARGTIGYIAPEVFLKSFGGVSYKSDVYSYGMLVLEMVGCRRKVYLEGEISSEQSFPDWIYRQLEAGDEENEEESGLIHEEMEMQRKMIVVSLWCVKTNPSSRPPMSKVVEMLEGTPESLQVPRAASLSASLLSQQRADSDISSFNDQQSRSSRNNQFSNQA
ncbi:LEAF RUST 10 DISEASE-RESISTANCE LOCUS RECEPTOR-LIKE PROTEIN KINASE-like 2.4 [Silene latifolia]|uniref:LEAF RUST 10 DISEASE-RESISTANCE LOCUS RECEPTOR-LIKE PROTEIN KINASE-like 2.4 n=1 Tax=Silene latifolia TaxID=37657 RepID=UPI003D78AFF1